MKQKVVKAFSLTDLLKVKNWKAYIVWKWDEMVLLELNLPDWSYWRILKEVLSYVEDDAKFLDEGGYLVIKQLNDEFRIKKWVVNSIFEVNDELVKYFDVDLSLIYDDINRLCNVADENWINLVFTWIYFQEVNWKLRLVATDWFLLMYKDYDLNWKWNYILGIRWLKQLMRIFDKTEKVWVKDDKFYVKNWWDIFVWFINEAIFPEYENFFNNEIKWEYRIEAKDLLKVRNFIKKIVKVALPIFVIKEENGNILIEPEKTIEMWTKKKALNFKKVIKWEVNCNKPVYIGWEVLSKILNFLDKDSELVLKVWDGICYVEVWWFKWVFKIQEVEDKK